MTTVEMTDRGRIVVPKEVRKRRGLADGTVFQFIDEPNGDLVLRPIQGSPKMDLLDHLKNFRDLEIPERHHYSAPRL